MLAHFRGVVAFAIRAFLVAFDASGELVVVEFHAESGLVRDFHAAIHELNAPAEDDFVSPLKRGVGK